MNKVWEGKNQTSKRKMFQYFLIKRIQDMFSIFYIQRGKKRKERSYKHLKIKIKD